MSPEAPRGCADTPTDARCLLFQPDLSALPAFQLFTLPACLSSNRGALIVCHHAQVQAESDWYVDAPSLRDRGATAADVRTLTCSSRSWYSVADKDREAHSGREGGADRRGQCPGAVRWDRPMLTGSLTSLRLCLSSIAAADPRVRAAVRLHLRLLGGGHAQCVPEGCPDALEG